MHALLHGDHTELEFLYVQMHVLIYEGRPATSSNPLINVFTFIFTSLKSTIIKICHINHFGKKLFNILQKMIIVLASSQSFLTFGHYSSVF